MKKILAFILVCVMTLATLVSCGNSTDTTPEASTAGATEAEVTLLGISTDFTPTVAANVVTVPRLLSDGNSDTTTTGATNDNIIDDVYSTFTVIYRTQTVIYFTINLSNPNNRYIMDFKLSCDEDDGVTVRQGTHESRINDPNTYIRWDEACDRLGNHQATFILTLPNKEISPTSIKISEMYYSDRTDGTNQSVVNMNNKDSYTIYKADSLLETINRKNSDTCFEFELAENENITVTSISVNGEAVTPDNENKYQIQSGKLVIKYDYNIANGVVYHTQYEEDIQTLKFERTYAGGCVTGAGDAFIYCKISGTDFEYKNITVKDQVIGYPGFAKTEIDSWGQYIFISNVKTHNLVLIICGTEFSRSFFDSLPAPQQ